jgi:hypothetical protein
MNELMLLRIAELLAEGGTAPDAPVTVGGGAFRFAVDDIRAGVVDGVEKGSKEDQRGEKSEERERRQWSRRSLNQAVVTIPFWSRR